MNYKYIWYVVACFLVLLAVPGQAALIQTRAIDGQGRVGGVDVSFWTDATATTPQNTIDWGFVSVGDSVPRSIWMRSDGNLPGTLSMVSLNWTPVGVGIETDMAVSWNLESYVISSGEIIECIFTLDVLTEPDPSVDQFTFDIEVTIAG